MLKIQTDDGRVLVASSVRAALALRSRSYSERMEEELEPRPTRDGTPANVPYAGESGFDVYDAGDMKEAMRAIAEEGRKHD